MGVRDNEKDIQKYKNLKNLNRCRKSYWNIANIIDYFFNKIWWIHDVCNLKNRERNCNFFSRSVSRIIQTIDVIWFWIQTSEHKFSIKITLEPNLLFHDVIEQMFCLSMGQGWWYVTGEIDLNILSGNWMNVLFCVSFGHRRIFWCYDNIVLDPCYLEFRQSLSNSWSRDPGMYQGRRHVYFEIIFARSLPVFRSEVFVLHQ